MGIGHVAVGFAAKRAAPRANLGVLLLAAWFLDLWWGVFILLGVEQARITPGYTAAIPLELLHYPYSHSLVATVLWSTLFAAVTYALTKDRRVAGVVALAVASHWVLDVVSHPKDVPVGIGGPLLGLGLWNSLPGSIAVESLMMVGGVLLYASATGAPKRRALVITTIVFVLVGVGAYLGPPPPSILPLAAFNLFATIPVVLLGRWLDRPSELINEVARRQGGQWR